MDVFAYISCSVMDKIEGHLCPRCGMETLDIYYEEGSDLQLGARCEECGLKGFFMNGKLVPLATT
jgi:DNA-directed RNA polymerase subunit RPC12/RpoP